ncbi:MAG: hypothetical protein H0W06_01485 [Chloroflexia bacterium]|nr:hypothetical protein [Chloroflexia bacterium]
MASPQKTIQIEPGSEVSKLLEEAAESALILQANGTRYRVNRIDPRPSTNGARRRRRTAPKDDPLLGILGIFDEGEPTDIARFKDQYIADAVDRHD